MNFNEVFTELGLEINEEQSKKLDEVYEKSIQSETDRVRTEYSKRIKELEKFKPIEQSAEQIELATLKKELADTKFQKSLKDIGVDDSIAKYLSSDIDLTEFSEVYKGFAQTKKDFIPNKNMNQNESSITKEQFKNMNYQQKAELYEKSPELFQLLNQK